MFISDAYAQTAGSAGGAGGGLLGLLPIILMFVVLYFLMIRPQMKRQKEQKAMIDALGKGDEVVSAGGVVGRVTKVGDAYITLEVAEGTEIILQKAAVTLLLIGHLALTTKRFLVTESSKARSDVDLAQSHRMLGLGYQGQGQLDMAFDYFRKLLA